MEANRERRRRRAARPGASRALALFALLAAGCGDGGAGRVADATPDGGAPAAGDETSGLVPAAGGGPTAVSSGQAADSSGAAAVSSGQAADARDLPPSVVVERPRDGESVRTVRPRVVGRATGHRSLYLGTRRVELEADGRFDAAIELAAGVAEIVVRDGDSPGEPLARVGVVVDLEAPLLDLDEPPGTALGMRYRRLCAASEVELSGRASDAAPGAVDRLTIDGEPVALDADGRFRVAVALDAEGANAHALALSDRAGNQARVELVLVRDLEPPRIELSEPAEGARDGLGETVVVAGRVEDAHPGTATLDGAPLALDERGRFRRELALAPGRSVVRLSAVDLAGNRSPELALELVRR